MISPRQQTPLGFLISHSHLPTFTSWAISCAALEVPVRSISEAILSRVQSKQ
ncbi:MAG TPA: hypothetical protein VEW28_06095 [Candidatus Kapabacteria bacterium]|nr:hypothetical protein [Candidatus Kapabacteria bacterium]